MLQGLANRVKRLIVGMLLPLLEGHKETPMHMLEADTAFSQYLQLIDPVMKIIFAASFQMIVVCQFSHHAQIWRAFKGTDMFTCPACASHSQTCCRRQAKITLRPSTPRL